ncbi:MAG: hypothetical protein ACQERJ_08930, partial [Bacillota bacterium]
MRKYGVVLIIILVVSLFCVTVTAAQEEQHPVQIGLLYDGQGQFEQQLKNEIQDEIKDVLGSNYQFEFVTATGS